MYPSEFKGLKVRATAYITSLAYEHDYVPGILVLTMSDHAAFSLSSSATWTTAKLCKG